MNKNQKTDLVSNVKEKLTSHSYIAIIHYRGMSEKELYNLRVDLKAKGCGIKIAKNTLVKVAIAGTELEILKSYLSGPTALIYSHDPVSLSKTISDAEKNIESLKIITALFNKAIVNENTFKEIAKLGSIDDVRASFIGLLKTSQTNFVRILSAPEKGLATLKTQ